MVPFSHTLIFCCLFLLPLCTRTRYLVFLLKDYFEKWYTCFSTSTSMWPYHLYILQWFCNAHAYDAQALATKSQAKVDNGLVLQ